MIRTETEHADLAARIARAARNSGRMIATAESLTGGQIACTLGAASEASQWYCGSIAAYSSAVKHELLRVPPGPVVSRDCATAMAATAAELLGADLVVAVTGAAGPDAQDGQPPGTVWLGLFDGGRVAAQTHRFHGEPTAIVGQTITWALQQLAEALKR